MEWARILAYITGSVNEELLLRNEYLATENRILKAQIKGRLVQSKNSSSLAQASVRSAKASIGLSQHLANS